MNRARAIRIANDLKGKKVGNWTVLDYIGNGKSALVVKAIRDEQQVALKIFDDDLVEEFGRDVQLQRIQLEKSLIGKKHPNLIEILDGGECTDTKYLYVVMAYLPRKNLSETINEVPNEKIFQIINQIASSAFFLEQNELVHRDIKPENISITDDFNHATLLDLGILKPIGRLSELTDVKGQKAFVGTLRYSPPEWLYREEENGKQAWQAVTFYQLGAVLYNILTKREIFHNISPYAKLASYIRDVPVSIKDKEVNRDLAFLAECCLVKNPNSRLELVSWSEFLNPRKKEPIEELREKIQKRKMLASSQPKGGNSDPDPQNMYAKFVRFQKSVKQIAEDIRNICINEDKLIPKFESINSEIISDSNGSITIIFRRNDSHHFYVHLLIKFFIVLFTVDCNELFELKFIAVTDPDGTFKDGYPDVNIQTFFKGPLDQKIINEKLLLVILSLIEKYQDIGAD